MQRYRIEVEFNGRDFVGWQRQSNGLSVQEAVETAIFRFCGETVTLHGAGRTDSGVHGLAMTAHFDLMKPARVDTVRDAINYHLRPNRVAVVHVAEVGQDFHARFSAERRHYIYRILNRRSPPALEQGRVWHVPVPLDAGRMSEAAAVLTGRHDFESFRSTQCQADNALRTLDQLDVMREGPEITIRASAKSFLHNQVRIMVGTLKLVGEQKWTPTDVEVALQACDRRAAGPTAPATGLYFVAADYPGDAGWAATRAD